MSILKPLLRAPLAATISMVLAACSGAPSPSAIQSAGAQGSAPTVAMSSAAATPAASSASSASTAPSAAASTELGALPKPEKTHLRIGAGITEMGQYPGILAAQAGIYEKYGITVEYSVFEGDNRTALAIQAGQIDLALASVSAALNSQLTDIPFDVLGVFALRSSDDLVCKSGIDTAEEVRGKKIAISGFGGTSNGAALLLLKELKLSPIDAAITSVGGQSVRLAALQAGSVDCAVIDMNKRADMTAQGFAIAASLENSTQQYGASGFEMTEEFVKANPNTALVVTAAILEAQNSIWLDPAAAVPYYAQFSGLKTEEAKAQVDDWLKLGNRTLMWSEDALKNPQKTIAVVNPDIIDVKVADAANPTLLQTLADNGFYKKVGNPLP